MWIWYVIVELVLFYFITTMTKKAKTEKMMRQSNNLHVIATFLRDLQNSNSNLSELLQNHCY